MSGVQAERRQCAESHDGAAGSRYQKRGGKAADLRGVDEVNPIEARWVLLEPFDLRKTGPFDNPSNGAYIPK